MTRTVITPHDPLWARDFAREAERIRGAVGRYAREVEHVGATSVPGLAARPVIDLLVAADPPLDEPFWKARLAPLGYEGGARAFGPAHLFFARGAPATHHVHVVERGSATHARHLLFRGRLRSDPALAADYARLRQDLAAADGDEREAAARAKGAFVAAALAGAPAPAAAVFEATALARERAASGKAYHEFFRAPTLSVGVYALPKGGTDPQSPHAEDEIYHVIRGRARFRAGESDRDVGPGSILFVRAGVEHRFHAIEEDLLVLVAFAPAEGTLR